MLACLCLAMATCLTACSTLGYYGQSIGGHLSLLSKQEPIHELLQGRQTETELKSRLALVQTLRDFASEELLLPDNDSYRSYADIGRPYVVWAVVAAEEFSLQPRTWCFPGAGCVSYRGYFSELDAREFAESLAADGYDVHVGGVAAYSTLGWFDDPLPSTVIRWADYEIAGLVFHELAHQVAYVKDDSAFNEAFAVTVEREGLRRWLEARNAQTSLKAYRQAQQVEDEFLDLVFATRVGLREIYQAPLSDEEKRRHKTRIFEQMRIAYQTLNARWGGDGPYDKRFAGDLNNARIVAVVTYHDLVPGFQALLAQEGGDLEAFYAAVKELGRLSREDRRQRLNTLARTTGDAG